MRSCYEFLSLSIADRLVSAALHKARQMKYKPMSVAVLDAGGHLVAFKREDHSSILRPQLAQAKAWGSLALGIGGRSLAERASTSPLFVAALGTISEGKIAPIPGGVLIVNADGFVLGAIGVTGDTPDDDEICALAAVEAVGLKAVT